MLKFNIIVPSSSPWCSPVVLAKKGESFRFCVNYKSLNLLTKKDALPLPRVDDLLDSFAQA